jgi:hypothetical protein
MTFSQSPALASGRVRAKRGSAATRPRRADKVEGVVNSARRDNGNMAANIPIFPVEFGDDFGRAPLIDHQGC